MKLFNKVAIVGVGLIGGSMGQAIKRNNLADEVVGISRHKKNLLLAEQRGAIDRGSQALGIVKDADLVILATPVNTIINLAPAISKIVGKECIVTDVGSTKKEIVIALEKFFPHYLGSHPLAGSEKRSIVYACPDIFKDSLCVLTPTKNTSRKARNLIKILWSKLGAKTVFLTPSKHDEILSFTSHLPHAVACSLIDVIPKRYLKFSSTGLKDTTRIAASDSELWADILLSNQQNILKAIALLQNNFNRISRAIRNKDRERLIKILKKAKGKRGIICS
jgi:prephenate dehydrogenase